ncbi:hypothetical protein [Parachryseolinea silvisoli]|uniref:hypothetical protein n=1 Tax=Parachryseolinea silvisoli TaxID=2873601 RepID=UPI0022658CDE|nr:hypothetical protein [Parachryseolinea silvisoli]MCD9015239.1 hypothetical protein [Parachryseolinea silvisoli]
MEILFNILTGIFGTSKKDLRINQNQPAQQITLNSRDVARLRRALLAFYPDTDQRWTLQQYRDHFDEIALTLIDLDVPDLFRTRVTCALDQANAYFGLLIPEDFIRFDSDQRDRNEVLSVLNAMAMQLNTILVELQQQMKTQ